VTEVSKETMKGTNNRTHRRAKFRMGLLLILTLAAFNSLLAQDVPVVQAGEGWGWSLGLSILRDPVAAKTPQSVGTWSWGGAYGHSYFVDPGRRMTVIWLTNTAMAGMAGEFPKQLINAVYGK
jgi:CubicO group peptidase (beta-lactamase class C family)